MAQLRDAEIQLQKVLKEHRDDDQAALIQTFQKAIETGLTTDISPVMLEVVKHLEDPLQEIFDKKKDMPEELERALKVVMDFGLTPEMSRVVRKVQNHLREVILLPIRGIIPIC